MNTTSKSRHRRVRLSRGIRPHRRYFIASLILHIVAIAAAMLLFTPQRKEPRPIEVAIILESGDSEAGSLKGSQAEEQAGQQQAAQPTEVTPRPNPKPVAPPRKATLRPVPAPAKAAPVARQVSPAVTQRSPVVEQAPAQATSPAASTSANDGQAASGAPAGSGTSAGMGAGQQAASSGGGGSSSAAGGGKTGRGASDYLERVRAALARHKRYPDQARKLKQEGTVSISLHIARDGTVLAAQIAKASGFPFLDEAVLQMARDASPLPPVPDDVAGDSVRIALPVSFSLGFFGRF